MRLARISLGLVSLVAAACGSKGSLPEAPATPAPSGDTGEFVQEGKEDNFLALRAQEYVVEGTTTVTIEDTLAAAPEAEKLRRVQQLVPLKQVVVGWFLNQYLAAKEHDQGNASYGGFDALTKNGAYEDLGIEAVDATTFRFTLRQWFGGKVDLLSKLPATTEADGRKSFELSIGKISNDEMARLETNAEWYRDAPWSAFDPAKVDAAKLDKVKLYVASERKSVDGWIDTNRLFADGKVTVGVHFGWDYHSEYHLKHSREVYDWMVGEAGFNSPVGSYDEYRRASGPLTKNIQANGKPILVEVSLFWGKPGTDTDPDTSAGGKVLEEDMRRSFAEREVIVFQGHSGPFYGFALANWRKTDEGDLDDSEIPSLPMPADVYQLVVAEGCDTYGLGEAFRKNPAKPGAKNVDVVTTTSFSNASTADGVKDTLRAVVGVDAAGNHKPSTFVEYLGNLDSNSYWFNTMYGVHGIDDNPHVHPYAVVANACKPCAADTDCGPAGNRCTKLGAGKFCSFPCTADDGCPQGYKCLSVQTGGTITSSQCAPSNMSCQAQPPAPSGPAVVLNELFASPLADLGGDANGDGTCGASSDEFVELVNVSAGEVDLTGWALSDSTMTRHRFASGTKLGPGKAMLVFGGGDRAKFAPLGGCAVEVASSGRLGLTNAGDTVKLADKAGKAVDQASYGPEGGKGVSLVREQDGAAGARWVVHPGAKSHSAGTRQDGTVF
jgi:hypothetical protein